MAPDEGMLNQGAQAPQGGLRIRRISATPGHSLELGPDGAPAPRTGPEYAKLIDISRCIGCKYFTCFLQSCDLAFTLSKFN